MKVLIDGDGLVYRCGFAVEKTKYLVDGMTGEAPEYRYCESYKEAQAVGDSFDLGFNIWSRKEIEPVENALALVKQTIQKIKDRYANADSYDIWLSPTIGNFRDVVAKRAKYKGNRDRTSKPTHYNAIREYLEQVHSARVYAGAEADDALAIFYREGDVLVSTDKDLLQVPGRHYNWVDNEERTVGKKEGAINLYTQILSGDSTDNIPGIEGVGPVKAHQMLKDCTGVRDCWETVLRAYRDKYGEVGQEYAVETARLVYLLREEDKHWTPPT